MALDPNYFPDVPTPPGNPYKDKPKLEPGDEVKIDTPGGHTATFIVPGLIAPAALPDLAPWIDQRLKKYRFFGSGASGIAICDYTPVKSGTKTKLGAF